MCSQSYQRVLHSWCRPLAMKWATSDERQRNREEGEREWAEWKLWERLQLRKENKSKRELPLRGAEGGGSWRERFNLLLSPPSFPLEAPTGGCGWRVYILYSTQNATTHQSNSLTSPKWTEQADGRLSRSLEATTTGGTSFTIHSLIYTMASQCRVLVQETCILFALLSTGPTSSFLASCRISKGHRHCHCIAVRLLFSLIMWAVKLYHLLCRSETYDLFSLYLLHTWRQARLLFSFVFSFSFLFSSTGQASLCRLILSSAHPEVLLWCLIRKNT